MIGAHGIDYLNRRCRQGTQSKGDGRHGEILADENGAARSGTEDEHAEAAAVEAKLIADELKQGEQDHRHGAESRQVARRLRHVDAAAEKHGAEEKHEQDRTQEEHFGFRRPR